VSPGLDSNPGAEGLHYPRRDSAGSEGIQLPAAMLAAVETLLNRYLTLDPEGARGFESIHGRIIGIEIQGLGLRLTLVPGPDRVQVFGAYDATPDCLIRGAPLALLRMVTAQRKEAEIGPGAVAIEGDTAIAHELAKALAGLDVDWEEQLARLVGDPIAHPVGRFARGLTQWGRRASDTLTADLKEYLEEEARLLPTPYELATFLAEVDALRDDVERLEARVERLARGRQAQPPRAPTSKGERAKGPGPAKAQ
jgi:ubiquinone biosynthesis accessory factor UbiJ